jgi:hypothetical protein
VAVREHELTRHPLARGIRWEATFARPRHPLARGIRSAATSARPRHPLGGDIRSTAWRRHRHSASDHRMQDERRDTAHSERAQALVLLSPGRGAIVDS